MTVEKKRCASHDQISDRPCAYYDGHGGSHHFAPIGHNTWLERDLRATLDEVMRARDEACDIADTAIAMRGDFIGRRNKRGSARIKELREDAP